MTSRPAPHPSNAARVLARLSPLAAWAALAAAVTYVLAFDPTDRVADPTGPCPWHALFGIDGPGCGGTRMVWFLAHGDLVQAARHHLAALVATLFALYALAAWTASATFGRRWPTWRIPRWGWAAFLVGFLLYAVVLRNLPWAPFTWFYVPNLV